MPSTVVISRSLQRAPDHRWCWRRLHATITTSSRSTTRRRVGHRPDAVAHARRLSSPDAAAPASRLRRRECQAQLLPRHRLPIDQWCWRRLHATITTSSRSTTRRRAGHRPDAAAHVRRLRSPDAIAHARRLARRAQSLWRTTRICRRRARARSSRHAADNLLPLLHVVLQPRPVMLPDKSTHEDAEDVAALRSNAAAAHASARTRCRRRARSSRRAVDHLLLLLLHLLHLLQLLLLLLLLMLLLQQPSCHRFARSRNGTNWTVSNGHVVTSRHLRPSNVRDKCRRPRLLRHAIAARAQLGAIIAKCSLRMVLQAYRQR